MKRVGFLMFASVILAAVSSCGDRSASRDAPPAVQRTASTGPVSLKLSLDRDRLTTADRLTLTLVVAAHSEAVVQEPGIPEDLGGFAVLETRRDAPRLSADGGLTTSTVWVLEPFLPGDYALPAFKVAYTDADGATGLVATDPINVAVESVLGPDEQDLAEIGPARDVVDPDMIVSRHAREWVIACGIAVVALGGGAAVWWYRHRRGPGAPDACRIAERRLRQIQSEPMADAAATLAAVEEASSLVRVCLAARLEPTAATRTTDELLMSPALTLNLSEHDMGVLRTGLRAADSAKFAGTPVSETEARALMAETLGLIRSLSTLIAITRSGSGLNPVGSPSGSPIGD